MRYWSCSFCIISLYPFSSFWYDMYYGYIHSWNALVSVSVVCDSCVWRRTSALRYTLLFEFMCSCVKLELWKIKRITFLGQFWVQIEYINVAPAWRHHRAAKTFFTAVTCDTCDVISHTCVMTFFFIPTNHNFDMWQSHCAGMSYVVTSCVSKTLSMIILCSMLVFRHMTLSKWIWHTSRKAWEWDNSGPTQALTVSLHIHTCAFYNLIGTKRDIRQGQKFQSDDLSS